jgi:hypothetical protein
MVEITDGSNQLEGIVQRVAIAARGMARMLIRISDEHSLHGDLTSMFSMLGDRFAVPSLQETQNLDRSKGILRVAYAASCAHPQVVFPTSGRTSIKWWLKQAMAR